MLWRLWDGIVDLWYRIVDSRALQGVIVAVVVAGGVWWWTAVRSNDPGAAEGPAVAATPFRVSQNADGNIVVEQLTPNPFPAPARTLEDCDAVEAQLADMFATRDPADAVALEYYVLQGEEHCTFRTMSRLDATYVLPLRSWYLENVSTGTDDTGTDGDPATAPGDESTDVTSSNPAPAPSP